MRSAVRGRLLAAALLTMSGPATAQDREPAAVEYEADRRGSEERLEADDKAYGMLFRRRRPVTFSKWVPANWSTDLGTSGDGIVRGTAFEPELTLDALWGPGPVRLHTEAGLFAAVTMDDPAPGTSGWWLTMELAGGDPATGLAPYLTYEPLALYEGVFATHLVTFHTVTLGVRRAFGPTALNLFLRRREGGAGPARNSVALHLNHVVPLGDRVSLALRGDVELRPFDRDAAGRRTDVRARIRSRLVVPLDPAVDLLFTADLQRNWSNRPDAGYSNLILGPAVSARFRF
jgi:hypothetical protein